MNLTRTNWPLGWVPSSDAVNGNPDGLLRADNLKIDRQGVTGLIDGAQILGTPATFASKFYTKIVNGGEYLWTAYGVPVNQISRTLAFTNAVNMLGPGISSPSDHASFGDAFGFVIGIAGKMRFKDPIAATAAGVKPLGVLTPNNIDGNGPKGHVNNAASVSLPIPTATVLGTGTAPQVIVDATTFEGACATDTAFFTDTTDIGGGRENRDIGLDILEIPVTVSSGSPELIVKVIVDFILDGTPDDPGTYNNYYELTFYGADIQSGEGTRSVLSFKRANAVRYGNDSGKSWSTVIGLRYLVVGLTDGIEVTFGAVTLRGGSGGLNGIYQYIQQDIVNTGQYLAKSPISELALNTSDNTNIFNVINGTVDLTAVKRDPNVSEHRFFRKSIADVGIDPNTGESLNASFLNQFYYVGSLLAGAPSTVFRDTLSDDEVIALNADGSFLPNLFLKTLNPADTLNGLQDTLYGIEGIYKERMIYLGASNIYLSDRLNPDAIDTRYILRPSGDLTEKNLWIKKLTNDVLILGTTKDLYEVSGTLLDFPDGSIDANLRPIGEAYPPLSLDVTKYEGGLFYLSADGLRVTSGSNSTNLSPQLRPFFKSTTLFNPLVQTKVHGVPIAKVFSGVGVNYSIAAAHQKIYFQIPCQDGTRHLFFYDTVTKTFGIMDSDPVVIHGTAAGELIGSFNHGYKSGGVFPTIWLLDAIPGFGFGPTYGGLTFKLRTVFDANGQPRNRKDTFTLKLVLDTGGRDVSVDIQKDGAGVSENDETSWINLGRVSANGAQTVYIPLDSSQVSLGFRYALQLSDVNGVFTFKLYEATIEYEPRPEQLNYLRILPTNLGKISRKRIVTFAFVIDTLGNNITFTPYLDNVAWGAVKTFSTGTKLTVINYFDSEAVATDIGGILSGGVFEFYGVNLEESISEKLPPPVTYLVIPGNDYGTPNRKRHTSYKFQINTRGTNVRFTPLLDGTPYSPTIFNTSRKQTVDYYFPQAAGDVIGIDIGGILESAESPKLPFEFYGVVVPQTVETLPDRLQYFRIPNSNFGIADRKRIRTISLILDTRGQPVVFTPYVDNAPHNVSATFTTTGKSTVFFYFHSDTVGVDFGGVLSTDTGTSFEFYALGTPDNVEPLPLPVTYYIIPPNNYGTPNRKRHTSYKWQMITRGGRVKFTPRLDQKEYEPAIYQTTVKQVCEYFFPQRAPRTFDDFGDVIGIDVGGVLESIENPPVPFEFYEVVTPQKIEVLPDRLQYLRIPNTNFGVASRKRIRTLPIVIDTYGYDIRFTPIVDDALYPPSIHRTVSKTTVHHFFQQDVFGTDFGGILSCESNQDEEEVPTTVGLTGAGSDTLSLSDLMIALNGTRMSYEDAVEMIDSLGFDIQAFEPPAPPMSNVEISVFDVVDVSNHIATFAIFSIQVLDSAISITDNLSLVDSEPVARQIDYFVLAADDVNVSDATERFLGPEVFTASLADLLQLSDAAIARFISNNRILTTDGILVSDLATLNLASTGVITDQTAAVQALIDSTPDGGTVIIDGIKGINRNGLQVNNRNNLTIMGHPTNGGGFKYIGAGTTFRAYSCLMHVLNCNNTTIKNLTEDSDNKPAEFIFMEGGSNNTLENLSASNIGKDDGGPPFAALHGSKGTNTVVRNCSVTNTQGAVIGGAVRGIWFGQGNDYETGIIIEDCVVENTGHTGIAVEGRNVTVKNCTSRDILVQGTGVKFIQRGPAGFFILQNCTIDDTKDGAGIMLEACNAASILIDGCTFIDCGDVTNSFGALYTSNEPATANLTFSNNILSNCRSFGALRFCENATFTNNTILSGSGQLTIETNGQHVFMTGGGTIETPVGPNSFDVWVDGVQIA